MFCKNIKDDIVDYSDIDPFVLTLWNFTIIIEK